MIKNRHDRILKGKPKEQHLSLAHIYIYIYIYVYIKEIKRSMAKTA